MSDRIRFRGGAADGETKPVPLAAAQVHTCGVWEDRRFSHCTPEGVPIYSYPTEVYLPTDEFDSTGNAIWAYSHTRPA